MGEPRCNCRHVDGECNLCRRERERAEARVTPFRPETVGESIVYAQVLSWARPLATCIHAAAVEEMRCRVAHARVEERYGHAGGGLSDRLSFHEAQLRSLQRTSGRNNR